mgnify:CR=1 FL=1
MLLLASAKKDLSTCSFRLFDVQKPKEEEMLSTEVTEEDLANAVEDEFGVKYSKDWKRLLKAPGDLKGKYVIREGVEIICDSAFFFCDSLDSITISNGVTSIGNCAFWYCGSLRSVTIPNSVISIGGGAFWDCSSLESIDIPDNVTSIGECAFEGCRTLRSVTIPNSVTRIGDKAFEGCI